jgi:tRNA(Ile2)-agmatinylcytidine synthase
MKSKGKNQGFQCIKCSEKSADKSILEIPRKIKQQLYIPSVSAHRHLSRPIQRYGKVNKDTKIDSNLRWFHIYNN